MMDAMVVSDTTQQITPAGSSVTSKNDSRAAAARLLSSRNQPLLSGSSWKAMSVSGMASRTVRAALASTSATCLSEQSLGTEQQHEDHEDERHRGPVSGIEESG